MRGESMKFFFIRKKVIYFIVGIVIGIILLLVFLSQ